MNRRRREGEPLRKFEKVIFFCVVGACLGFLIIYNAITDGALFLKAPLINIVSILLAVFVAYYFTQQRADERKAKELTEHLIEQIQDLLNQESINWTEDTIRKHTLLSQRRIRYKIDILKPLGTSMKISDDILYIEKEYSQYAEFVGNHSNDVEYLNKSEIELMKYKQNIETRCDVIKCKLYAGNKGVFKRCN